MSEPNLSVAFGLPPERAIEFFRSKGLQVASDWKQVAAATRAGAYSVAAVLKADVLQDIRGAMDKAMTGGQNYADFKRALRPLLASKGYLTKVAADPATGEVLPGRGVRPWHLDTVFRTNTQSSYMAGRHKAQVENAARRGNWMYVAVIDGRTRQAHRALNGRVFRWDDPVWSVAYPPNGYRCRCRVRALSDAEMQSERLELSSGAGRLETVEVDLGPRGGKVTVNKYRDPMTGDLVGPDPGFDHAPAGAWGRDVALARSVQAIQSREIRVQAWQALNQSPQRAAAFRGMVDKVLDTGRAGHDGQVIGFVDEAVADFARRMAPGVEPTRVAVMTEKELLHAASKKHADAGIALTREQYATLPGIVAQPDAVFWDNVHGNITLVRQLVDGDAIYMPLTLDYRVKKIGQVDAVVNAYRVKAALFKNRGRFVPMEGA